MLETGLGTWELGVGRRTSLKAGWEMLRMVCLDRAQEKLIHSLAFPVVLVRVSGATRLFTPRSRRCPRRPCVTAGP